MFWFLAYMTLGFLGGILPSSDEEKKEKESDLIMAIKRGTSHATFERKN